MCFSLTASVAAGVALVVAGGAPGDHPCTKLYNCPDTRPVFRASLALPRDLRVFGLQLSGKLLATRPESAEDLLAAAITPVLVHQIPALIRT